MPPMVAREEVEISTEMVASAAGRRIAPIAPNRGRKKINSDWEDGKGDG
jgi:hypothetical protein